MPPLRAPEILAPAGDEAALRAAVEAGADAVYFGLQGWNARARATNFDGDALRRSLDHLHARGARGYVTLNTLVFDDELPALEGAVRACARAGADAVIVQDIGVARLVRAVAPGLPVHASTQMTCSDAASVEWAHALGASRVILARELSLDEIAAIRATTAVEVEVFVHGALCISWSGQCLTSEAIGGRSANRGACAQACRLPYEAVVDGVLHDTGDRAFLLSPEDLDASALVPRLVELGVSSLKIEGRLKGPDYVAATTRLYRAAVDAAVEGRAAPEPRLREAALQAFSRGSGPGFLAGVDHLRLVEGRASDHRGLLVAERVTVERVRGRALLSAHLSRPLSRGDGILVEGGRGGAGELGGRVWALEVDGRDVVRAEAGERARVWLGPERTLDGALAQRLADAPARLWKSSDPAVERDTLAAIEGPRRRQQVDILVDGILGEPARITARAASGLGAEVRSDAILGTSARAGEPGAASLRAVLAEKLGRLGETPFALGALEVRLPDEAYLPPASINRARRALTAALLEGAHREHAATDDSAAALLAAAVPPQRAAPEPGLWVLCRDRAQADAALDSGADGVYLDFLALTGTGEALRGLRAAHPRARLGVAPPRVRKPGEDKIDRYLAGLAPDAVLVRSLGALRDAAVNGEALRIGDFSLNVANRLTAAAMLAEGLAAFTPSFDLDAAQLLALLDSPFAPWAELVVHHPMPLFHMEHCVIAALLGDGGDHHSCGRPCERHRLSLRDRAGMAHPVEADVGCRNTVFHAAAQSAAGVIGAARRRGVGRFRIELVREGAEEAARIVRTYRALLDGQRSPAELFRDLRTEGGYGVVRGSLRVLPR